MRFRSLLVWVMVFALQPFVAAAPAVASNPSRDAWMFDLAVGATPVKYSPSKDFDAYRTADLGGHFFEITTQSFSPVTFTWSLSPGATLDRIELYVSNEQDVDASTTTIDNGPFTGSYTLTEPQMCYDPLDQNGQCPAGSESSYAELRFVVVAEDTVTMSEYVVQIFRQLDIYANTSHTLTFMNPEALPGSPPPVQTGKTGHLFEIPGPGTLEKDGYYLEGWGLYKPDGSYDGFVDRDTYIWSDQSYNLRPVWVVDAVDLISLGIEQETPVDVVWDGDEQLLSLVPDAFDRLDFTWTFGNVENYEIQLFSYPANTLLDSVDSALTPRKFLNVGADCLDPTDPACSNAFKILVESKSPSGTSSITNTLLVYRAQSLDTSPTFSVDLGDGASSGVTLPGPGFYTISDWFDIELLLSEGEVAKTFTYTIAGQNYTVGDDEYIPIGQDLTVTANVVPVSYPPVSLTLFDFDFRFAPCPTNIAQQCLERVDNNVLQERVTPSSYQNPTLGQEGGGIYYLTLPVNNAFLLNDPTDDNLQSVSANFEEYIYDLKLSMENADHRFDYDANFGKSSTQFNPQLSYTDSELCEQSLCREVLQVTLESSWQNLDWKSELFVILDFDTAQIYNVTTVDRNYNPLNPQPPATSQPINRSWLDFETAAETGFTLIGWSSFNSASWILPQAKFPVLEDETLYPVFGFDIITHSEGSQGGGFVPQVFFLTELADPVHSQNFIFEGWSLTDGGDPIADPQNYLVNGPGPVNLYAVFTDPSFDIRLNIEGNWITNTYTSTTLLSQITMPTHSQNHTFVGWSLTDGGAIITDSNTQFSRPGPHDLYAVFQAPAPQQSPPQPNPAPAPIPAPAPTPTQPPAPTLPVLPETSSPQTPTVESSLAKITTSTKAFVSVENGVTAVEAVVPAKYVNRPARIEIRRVIGGKVRYYLIGKAWTHYDRKRNDFTKAAMTFRFPLALEPDDVIRVKVRGIQVIRATGEGKPAWR